MEIRRIKLKDTAYKTIFQGLKKYFHDLKIYFQALKIYNQALEIVLERSLVARGEYLLELPVNLGAS